MGGPNCGHYGIGAHFDRPFTGILCGYHADIVHKPYLNPMREPISFSNLAGSLDSCPGLYTVHTDLFRHDWIQGTRQNYVGMTYAVMLTSVRAFFAILEPVTLKASVAATGWTWALDPGDLGDFMQMQSVSGEPGASENL